MKKILVFSALMTACMFPAFSQSIWDNILLADDNAKITSTFKQPRFSLTFTGKIPPGGLASRYVGIEQLRYAAFSPGTAENLFEKLGGEFFIGNPSDPTVQHIELIGVANFIPGMRLDISVGKRIEFQTGVQYYKAQWSGAFPVFVLPHLQSDPTQPQYFQGVASASLSAILLDMEAVFFVATGKFRPYAKAGVRGCFPVENTMRTELAGVTLPLEYEIRADKFSIFAGSGVRWFLGKNIFLEGGFSFGKLPGNDYQFAAEANFGWKF